jgi:hypothetical protein
VCQEDIKIDTHETATTVANASTIKPHIHMQSAQPILGHASTSTDTISALQHHTHTLFGSCMHVEHTYVAGRQQYGICSPACMYKSSLTSSFICRYIMISSNTLQAFNMHARHALPAICRVTWQRCNWAAPDAATQETPAPTGLSAGKQMN